MQQQSGCARHGATPISRRTLFERSSKIGLLAASFTAAGQALAIGPQANQAMPGARGPALGAFALSRVRLLDSPFRHAQDMTARYLLSLDPDRLLHGFRRNAGLKPKAPIYGGWESEPTWADINCHGHTLGHYLSGCALMAAATGRRDFTERLRYVTGELAHCQAEANSGLVCAFPDGPALMARLIAGERISGVPWYTLHKVMAGLRDAHVHAGLAQSREVLVRLADWCLAATRQMSQAEFEAMLAIEHGGMNELFADLHVLTGNSDYLAMAKRFSHKALLAPLARQHDHLDGLHANTQIPKVIGFQRLAEVGGDADYARAARFFWRTVVNVRSFANGGHGDLEHFQPVAAAEHALSAKASETCGIYNMLRLTRMLFMQERSADYADFYEQALYNGILASQDPDSGMVTYFQGNRPGYAKLYCTPQDSFWCCTGSGMESHAKYGDSIYFHDPAGLYVNLLIPSVLDWREMGAVITQQTGFPDQPVTRLSIGLKTPQSFALNLRHPGWSRQAVVRVNGLEEVRSETPGRYLVMERRWHDGDQVELQLDMATRAVALAGDPSIFALMHGPILLAGALGTSGLASGSDIVVNERKYGEYLPEPFAAPKLAGTPAEIAASVVAAPAPLTFTVRDAAGGALTLVPYMRIHHQRYAIYWQV